MAESLEIFITESNVQWVAKIERLKREAIERIERLDRERFHMPDYCLISACGQRLTHLTLTMSRLEALHIVNAECRAAGRCMDDIFESELEDLENDDNGG